MYIVMRIDPSFLRLLSALTLNSDCFDPLQPALPTGDSPQPAPAWTCRHTSSLPPGEFSMLIHPCGKVGDSVWIAATLRTPESPEVPGDWSRDLRGPHRGASWA